MASGDKRRPDGPSRARRVGRAVVDGFLAIALCYMMFLITTAAVDAANERTELRLLTDEAETLYQAFGRYNERNHGYPSTYTGSRFDVATLDPLRKRGYYRGSLTSHLLNHRVDAYDSPDDLGPNREFWLEMSLRSDPSVRVLVARSDDAPLGGGTWREGVFIFQDGVLEQR
jgi:hypothetical protein